MPVVRAHPPPSLPVRRYPGLNMLRKKPRSVYSSYLHYTARRVLTFHRFFGCFGLPRIIVFSLYLEIGAVYIPLLSFSDTFHQIKISVVRSACTCVFSCPRWCGLFSNMHQFQFGRLAVTLSAQPLSNSIVTTQYHFYVSRFFLYSSKQRSCLTQQPSNLFKLNAEHKTSNWKEKKTQSLVTIESGSLAFRNRCLSDSALFHSGHS